MKIRKASKGDVARLVELDHIAKAGLEGRNEFIAEAVGKGDCYVSCLDQQVVGYVVLNYTFYGNGWVGMLYIEDKVRRKGYGNRLLEHVERLCRETKLFTSTNLSNLRMQRLLEKRRFVISGVIHNLDENDPEVVYFKKI